MVERLAHRGTLADENTWRGITAALETAGVDGVEVDLQISSDDVVFLHHDRTLRRLAGRQDSPLALPWSELESLVLPHDQRLVRLEALLERWPEGRTLNLELKDGGERLVAATLQILSRRPSYEHIVLSSFDTTMLEACRECGMSRALLLEVQAPAWLHASGVDALGCDGVHVQADLVSPALVGRYRDAGITVGVWGGRSTAREAEIEALGVQRIISDFLVDT